MMMIEIEDSKVERMSDYAEKMLKYVMETVADTAEDTGTVMAAARWASAAECPEQDAIQDTVSLTRRDGGFPRPG